MKWDITTQISTLMILQMHQFFSPLRQRMNPSPAQEKVDFSQYKSNESCDLEEEEEEK